MTFGISKQAIPIRNDGILKEELNKVFLRERRDIEAERSMNNSATPNIQQQHQGPLSQQQNSGGGGGGGTTATTSSGRTIIEYPGPNDVLLGRGRPFQEYIGNRQFISLVEAERERYQRTEDKFEKTCISIDIVKKIQDIGGRFLDRTEEGWEVVNDVTAREKASRAFRAKYSKETIPEPLPPSPMFVENTRNKRIRYTEQDFDMEG